MILENKKTITIGVVSTITVGALVAMSAGKINFNALNFESSKNKFSLDGNQAIEQIKDFSLSDKTDYKLLYNKALAELKRSEAVIEFQKNALDLTKKVSSVNATENISVMKNVSSGILINFSKTEITVGILSLLFILSATISFFESIQQTNNKLNIIKLEKEKSLKRVRDIEILDNDIILDEHTIHHFREKATEFSNQKLIEWNNETNHYQNMLVNVRDRLVVYETAKVLRNEKISPAIRRFTEKKSIAITPANLNYRKPFDKAMFDLIDDSLRNVAYAKVNNSFNKDPSDKEVKPLFSITRSAYDLPQNAYFIENNNVKYLKLKKGGKTLNYRLDHTLDDVYKKFCDDRNL